MSMRVLHPLLRFILFFALTLTVGLPMTALAAPVSQKDTTTESEAVLLSFYETDVIAIDDAESVVIGLSLYDDDTFELSIDLLDGEGPSVGYGDYEETDDGVLLTLLGADEEDFDESTELELVYDADDTLVLAGTPDGLFGEEDIILYPADTLSNEESADETADPTNNDLVYELGGVYISPLQPSETTDGVVYLLNLTADGDASFSSDYLDLEAPTFELGTWTDNGDNTVTVEIIGTAKEDYDDAIVLDFEVGEYGELMIDDLSLYPLTILSYLEDDTLDHTDDDSGTEIGNDESDVIVYVAEITVPDETEPLKIYMLIYDDGTAVLSNEQETTTLYGEWIDEGDTLSVSITNDDESVFDEPVEFVFEVDEEDALVATTYPVDVFGEDGLIFYPADEDNNKSVAEGEFYFYESDTLPSIETDGIVISLILGADGGAFVSSDLMNDEDPVVEYGEWMRDEDGAVILTISEGPDGTYDEPYVFTFEENADDLSLLLIEESVELFGDIELVFHRIE